MVLGGIFSEFYEEMQIQIVLIFWDLTEICYNFKVSGQGTKIKAFFCGWVESIHCRGTVIFPVLSVLWDPKEKYKVSHIRRKPIKNWRIKGTALYTVFEIAYN